MLLARLLKRRTAGGGQVLMGKSCVRVRHEGVTKGALVEHILDHYAKRGGADFILCLGDDRMDERMFAILRDYHQAAQYRVAEHAQQEVAPPAPRTAIPDRSPARAGPRARCGCRVPG